MAYSDIPKGVDRDYYVSGRGRALYQLKWPLAPDPPPATPMWWSNEGIKDAWQKLPSRVGVEAIFNDENGPMPLKLGVPDPQTGLVPQGPYDGQRQPTGGQGQPPQMPQAGAPAPNPGIVRLPQWADDYWSGYLWALQDPGTAIIRRGQGNTWTPDYQKGLADGLARTRPSDPRGFAPSPAQLAQLPFAIPTGQFVTRPAPVYVPKGNGPGVWVPPPGQGVPMPATPAMVTKEIFGLMRGRPVSVWSILNPDGLLSHVKRGGRVAVGVNSSEGFGLGGSPGAWSMAAGSLLPSAYGLDPGVGVVAFDGRQPRPLDSHTLEKMLGLGWRAILQAAT